jgi:hypothetical protein
MSEDKAKAQPKSTSPDELAKTKKGSVELTEQELRKAAGGVITEKVGPDQA